MQVNHSCWVAGRVAFAAGLAALAMACGDPETTEPSVPGPSLSVTATEPEELGDFKVCKVGTAASFTVTVNGGAPFTVNLAAGECSIVVTSSLGDADVTVTENISLGTTLTSIDFEYFDVYGNHTVTSITGTNTVSGIINGDVGRIATFNNEPTNTLGRMTGGGSQTTIGGLSVTRGFTIHCDIVLSNNLEINWSGNKWHLTKPLTSAVCIDDPAVDPGNPPAPFDTFIGEGVGELNGAPGSTVKFTFVDSGEPGGNADMAQIQIWSAGGSLVLDVPLSLLTKGNLQAHYDQPHGNKP